MHPKTVFFHGGRAGIEPEYSQQFALMRYYEPGIARFPHVQFVLGHSGARDVGDAIPLAQRYENAWLDIHGQGVTLLDEIIPRIGSSSGPTGPSITWRPRSQRS
jgi:predicted TIM-barrel fold metal-dependent hydrolase